MRTLGFIFLFPALISCAPIGAKTEGALTWKLTYLQGYDTILQAKAATASEPQGNPSINENTLSEIKRNRDGQAYRWFNGCNGAAATFDPSQKRVKVEMSITQVGCSELIELPNGRITEATLSAREIADEALRQQSLLITAEYIDPETGELTWQDADGSVIARFVVAEPSQ